MADDAQARLRAEAALPAGVSVLAELARNEGYRFVDRLVGEWQSGANPFSAPGEVFLSCHLGERLVGFGGLNRDPYCAAADVGRIRHVYLEPAARGRGLGGALVRALVGRAEASFARLRLATDDAGDFYEHLGFTPSTEPRATHVLVLRGAAR